MKHFRKIWDEEKNTWIKNHSTTDIKVAYELFCKTYPEADVSLCAFKNQRSRLGAVLYRQKHVSTKRRPLYSEHTKKGYVHIKVAQPNMWKLKNRWVYEETHPGYEYSKEDAFLFLDGNNRNFHPSNIEMIKKSELLFFQRYGGTVKGNPELTKVHILQARLRRLQFDAGEKTGDVVYFENVKNRTKYYRVFRSEINEKARRRNANLTEEERQTRNAKARERYAAKRKWLLEHPEALIEFKKQQNEYKKKYKKRGKRK